MSHIFVVEDYFPQETYKLVCENILKVNFTPPPLERREVQEEASGSNGGASGSTGDNSRCFGSGLFSSHPESYGVEWIWSNCQLSDHSSVSGSVEGTQYYPTGSNQTSSIKVYSPKCDQMYMARLYHFTASKGPPYGGVYTITDIEDERDETHEIPGSKNEF